MMLKMIGAVIVISACGGFGFSIAAAHKKEERSLHALLQGIEFMICELEYHNTPLPELCRKTGAEADGQLYGIFSALARELDAQLLPDASACMKAVLLSNAQLPQRTHRNLAYLGQCMGRFALSGQLSGFRSAAAQCRRDLDSLSVNRDARLRSYRTLGICCGIALVILFF